MRLDPSNGENEITIREVVLSYFDNDNTLVKNSLTKLSKEHLRLSEFANNKVKGTISLEKEKMLFLSIPFDKGWKAKVDGRNVSIQKINLGFIGIPLQSGTHEVELSYKPPYLMAGLYTTLLSLLILVIYYVYSKRKGKLLNDKFRISAFK
ncbi:Bacterial membrane protein YfhO [compost metagenome]